MSKKKKNWFRKQPVPIRAAIIGGFFTIFVVFVQYFLPYVSQIYKAISEQPTPFPQNVTGVLVLDIENAPEDGRIKSDLIATLNTKLDRSNLKDQIEVRGGNDEVKESLYGLPSAHDKARKIGQLYGADIVIWGNYASENKIHARVTVSTEDKDILSLGDVTYSVKSGATLEFQNEVVHEAVLLSIFINGYRALSSGNYEAAIDFFDTSVKNEDDSERDIGFYRALSYWYSGTLEEQQQERQKEALRFFKKLFFKIVKENRSLEYSEAKKLNTLACIYNFMGYADKSEEILLFLIKNEQNFSNDIKCKFRINLANVFITAYQQQEDSTIYLNKIKITCNEALKFATNEFQKAVIYEKQAICFDFEKEYAKSRDRYSDAIRIAPSNYRFNLNLAKSFAKEGDFSTAAKSLKRILSDSTIVKTKHELATVVFDLAAQYSKMNNADSSCFFLNEYKSLWELQVPTRPISFQEFVKTDTSFDNIRKKNCFINIFAN